MIDSDAVIRIHDASVQDRGGTLPSLKASRRAFLFVQLVFADSGYSCDRVPAAGAGVS